MVQAHKLQIDLGKYCGSILGLRLGSLWPTMNPYGFLVVKQKKKPKRLSWPRECKSVNGGGGGGGLYPILMELFPELEGGKHEVGSEAEVGISIKGEKDHSGRDL